MGRIRVVNEVTLFIDDQGSPGGKLIVESHQAYSEKVVLKFKDDKYIVFAKDLKNAIKNATNAA
jgi:hypothetical protein